MLSDEIINERTIDKNYPYETVFIAGNKVKLLHITATHLNLTGGIPVVLRELVNAQNKIEGFEARVLSVVADVFEMKSQYFDHMGNKFFEEYICGFLPDVVIFHSHYYFEYLKLYKTLIKLGIPYFIEPHGSFGKAALQKSKYKKLVANEVLLRSFMKKAKGYIFLNEREKADSKYRTGCDLVIANGINADEILEEYESKEQWSFYFIGRFDISHKGLDYLFDALDILEQKGEAIRLELYGTGPEENIAYINNRIRKYSSLQVTNCGPVYGAEQKELLEKRGVMVLTSRYEGFPMTVLEAWKYGNPCLVTAGTNVKDEVVAHQLGWGTDLNSNSIANAILQAQKDYSLRKEEYIRNCKSYVKNMYSWDHLAQVSYDRLSKVCSVGEKL